MWMSIMSMFMDIVQVSINPKYLSVILRFTLGRVHMDAENPSLHLRSE